MHGIYAGEGVALVPSDGAFEAIVKQCDPMLLSAFAREIAVFLYYRRGKGELAPMGTGFVVSKPIPGLKATYWYTLVTARHVIEDIRHYTSDQVVYVRANSRTTNRAEFYELPISAWRFHPDDTGFGEGSEWREASSKRRYDVAVAPCPKEIIEDAAVVAWPTNLIVNDDAAPLGIDQGDDLAIVGLYHQHVGVERITPIVRAGMIAAMPSDELVQTPIGPMSAYLIEARSTGGLSGSPVVRLSHPVVLRDDPLNRSAQDLTTRVSYRLLGLVSGSFDTPGVRLSEGVNEGIAFVVPAVDIIAAMDQEAIVSEQKDEADKLRAEGTRSSGAHLDSLASRDDDEDRVSLDGADPEDALRALLKTPPSGRNQDPA